MITWKILGLAIEMGSPGERPLILTLSRGVREKRTRWFALLSISIDDSMGTKPGSCSLSPRERVRVRGLSLNKFLKRNSLRPRLHSLDKT
jgi:hypothetical protein